MRLFAILFLLVTASSFADDSAPTVRATRHGGKLGKRFSPEREKRAGHGIVRGHCTLLESPLNPLAGPCIGIPLELKDEKGKSLGVSRTTEQGDFDFAAEPEGPFTIAPTSSRYVVVGTARPLKKGERAELKIREKN